jgi:tetratricopeptide (TPR) repeat protein
LNVLGSDGARILSQFELMPLPTNELKGRIDSLARRLAGEEQKEFLRDRLFHRFAQAAPQRQIISISKLIEELSQDKIALCAPVKITPNDLSPAAIATVGVLQDCVTSLPQEVLTQAIRFDRPIEDELKPLIDGHVLAVASEVSLAGSLRSRFRTDAHDKNVADTLKALLSYISKHSSEKWIRRQVHNAVQLAKVVLPDNPETAAGVFPVVEKILKRAGNKHLVLEVATLTLAAVKRSPPSRETAEMKALALICGVSWAYQRLDCLREARVAGERSMEIGESIGWPRNTAFCLKCLGRLYRLEAERCANSTERDELFAKSEQYLQRSIEHFSEMKDFGPEHSQVGDCNALLARTFLAQNKSDKAFKAVEIADSLITDIGGKEHLDVVILRGDLAAASGKLATAESLYSEALAIVGDDDDERTEMRARAHLQRGRNRRQLADSAGAHVDFAAAAAIWADLNEPKLAAEAELEELRGMNSLGLDSRALVFSQPALIAVTAIKLHAAKTQSLPAAIAHRAKDPGVTYWKQIIKDAAAKVAIEYPEP